MSGVAHGEPVGMLTQATQSDLKRSNGAAGKQKGIAEEWKLWTSEWGQGLELGAGGIPSRRAEVFSTL